MLTLIIGLLLLYLLFVGKVAIITWMIICAMVIAIIEYRIIIYILTSTTHPTIKLILVIISLLIGVIGWIMSASTVL